MIKSAHARTRFSIIVAWVNRLRAWLIIMAGTLADVDEWEFGSVLSGGCVLDLVSHWCCRPHVIVRSNAPHACQKTTSALIKKQKRSSLDEKQKRISDR
jgi:hypothetical protein